MNENGLYKFNDVEKSYQTTPFKAWTFRASKKLNKPRLSSRGYTQSFFDLAIYF